MSTRLTILAVLIAAILILSGCQGENSSGFPTDPPISNSILSQAVSNQNLWGFYSVEFNPDTLGFVIKPVRGAEFQANVTKFLQPPITPINLLSVSLNFGQSDIPNGLVSCDVTLNHPFPGVTILRGFDVMGIVMGDSSYPGAESGDLFPGYNELKLLNADGYSRWWNPTEFTTYGTIFGYTQGSKVPGAFVATGTINGYKYFADDLEPDESMLELNPETRGTFGVAPGINSRTYLIQFPFDGIKPSFKFNYAITASYYGPDTHDDPEYPVSAFPISANLAEAFMFNIQDAGSTAYWENESTYGGDLKLDVEVFDWGLGSTSSVEDEIAGIYAGGDVLGGFTWFPIDELDSEPGSSIYSYIFHFDFFNLNLTGLTGQDVIFGVRSIEPASYAPDIPGITGVAYPENAHLTAYTVFEPLISNIGPQDNQAPEVGVIEGPDHVFQADDTEYTLTFAADLEDGTNLTILWDNDGDLDFDDDLDGDDGDLHATLNWPDEGYFNIIARAVDSEALYTDSDPFQVLVEGCPTEAHNNFSTFQYSDGDFWPTVTFETAWQTVGDFAGKCLIQNKKDEIRAYDVDGTNPWPGVPYITIPNSYNNDDFVWSIDVCDLSGRVLVAVMNKAAVLDPDIWYTFDNTGNFLIELSVGAAREPQAFDTDDNGNLYILTWDNNTETSQMEFWQYLEDAPYYEYVAEVDCTDHFEDQNLTWDIALSYTLDRLYSLKGNYGNDPAPYGELYCWDIQPDGTLVFNEEIQTQQAFPGKVIGSYTDFHGSLTNGDFEIDHSWEGTEGCRLILMARSFEVGGDYIHVLDGDLNVMATTVAQGYGYGISIRPADDPQDRDMVMGIFQSDSSILLSPAPLGW